jgi:Ca-activated chloride channel family protein
MELLKFENPEFLHLLWGVFVLLFFFIWVVKHKNKLVNHFGKMESLQKMMKQYSVRKRNLKFSLLILSYVFFIVAFANPQIGTKLEDVKREGVDIIVALDVSKSMLAEDIKPNRLQKAKHELSQLIDLLQGDRIGLVAFAGIPHVQCPLTLDYSAAKLFLGIIDVDLIPQPGTAIGSAIDASIKAFNSEERKHKVLILITDGEDHETDPLDAAKLAEQHGVKIYAIGIGSQQGVPIPEYDRYGRSTGFKKDKQGGVVTTKLDILTLQKIAFQTGGKFYQASSGEAELDEIYKEIAELEKKELVSKQFSQYEDRFQIFLALGLILLILEVIIPEKRKIKAEWRGRFV